MSEQHRSHCFNYALQNVPQHQIYVTFFSLSLVVSLELAAAAALWMPGEGTCHRSSYGHLSDAGRNER